MVFSIMNLLKKEPFPDCYSVALGNIVEATEKGMLVEIYLKITVAKMYRCRI